MNDLRDWRRQSTHRRTVVGIFDFFFFKKKNCDALRGNRIVDVTGDDHVSSVLSAGAMLFE